MNSLDPWSVTQSSPPSDVMVVPPPYYGHPFIDECGVFVGAVVPPRADLTAALAPVLAPATGGYTARFELDPQQRLHAAICIDGKCYQTSIDLAPAIAAVLAKIAQAQTDMHASTAGRAPVISGDVALGAVDKAVTAAGGALIGALVDQHKRVACAGWLDDIGSAVADTVQKFKGPITAVAAKAAEAYGGPAAGAAASQLVGPIIDRATNKGAPPQKTEAEQAAQTDPAAAAVLSTAKDAVAHTIAAYHVTETAKQAASGQPEAQRQIAAVVQDAEKGDPVAHAVTDLIANGFSTAVEERQRAARPAAPVERRPAPAAPVAPVEYRPAPAAPAEYRPPATYQQIASRAVVHAQHKRQQQNLGPVAVFGYLRQNKHHKVYLFNSHGEAQNWYGTLAPGYNYAALFDAQNLAAPAAENFGTGAAVSGW